jgi:hypothetical protein
MFQIPWYQCFKLKNQLSVAGQRLYFGSKDSGTSYPHCTVIEMAESVPLDDEEKITKDLAHWEERPAPQVADSEKVYIFSNSAHPKS